MLSREPVRKSEGTLAVLAALKKLPGAKECMVSDTRSRVPRRPVRGVPVGRQKQGGGDVLECCGAR
jgi:hypothetical protein